MNRSDLEPVFMMGPSVKNIYVQLKNTAIGRSAQIRTPSHKVLNPLNIQAISKLQGTIYHHISDHNDKKITTVELIRCLKDVSKKCDEIEKKVGNPAAYYALIEPLRDMIRQILSDISNKIQQVFKTPEKCLRSFFDTYEELNESKQYLRLCADSAYNQFQSEFSTYQLDESVRSTYKSREYSTLLEEIAWGLISKDTMAFKVSDVVENMVLEALVNQGFAVRDEASNRVWLNPNLTDDDIDKFHFDWTCIDADRRVLTNDRIRQCLKEFKQVQLMLIHLKSNPDDLDMFKPDVNNVLMRKRVLDLKKLPEHLFHTDEMSEQRIRPSVLELESPFMKRVIEKTSIIEDLRFFSNYLRIPDTLKLASSRCITTAKRLNDYVSPCHKGGVLHEEIVELLKDLEGNFSVHSYFSSIDSINEDDLTFIDKAIRVYDIINLIKEDYDRLEKKYHTKQEMSKSNNKKLGVSFLNGLLSPIKSPVDALVYIFKKGIERYRNEETHFEALTGFATGVGQGSAEKLLVLLKWLGGPITDSVTFFIDHSNEHDLSEALGRCLEHMPGLNKTHRRVNGVVAPSDFSNVPPLGGNTFKSSKEISEELHGFYRKKGFISSDNNAVNLRCMLTEEISTDDLHVEVKNILRTVYQKYRKPYTDEEVLDAHAEKLLEKSLEKLMTLGGVNGKLFLTFKAQQTLEFVKNTTGCIAATGSGVLAIVLPPTFIFYSILSGLASLGSASLKVVIGSQHLRLTIDKHRELYKWTPFSRLTPESKKNYKDSFAHIMELQDQIIKDATHGIAILVSTVGGGVTSQTGNSVHNGMAPRRDFGANPKASLSPHPRHIGKSDPVTGTSGTNAARSADAAIEPTDADTSSYGSSDETAKTVNLNGWERLRLIGPRRIKLVGALVTHRGQRLDVSNFDQSVDDYNPYYSTSAEIRLCPSA